jgi:hypothetical protein
MQLSERGLNIRAPIAALILIVRFTPLFQTADFLCPFSAEQANGFERS